MMLKELGKMGYTSCDLIKNGAFGVIFKIQSPKKGTNVLKIDYGDESSI